MSRKEEEKRLKYQPLLFEFRRVHRGFKVHLVVFILGSLGGMKDTFVSELKIIPACRHKTYALAAQMQKAVILGSLRLLRQHDSGLH
uniref:Uncharacterized protein n=1 Tax=Bracon brevicornis TaxID=1563983 RepID=A0A6V7LQ79_9HYME